VKNNEGGRESRALFDNLSGNKTGSRKSPPGLTNGGKKMGCGKGDPKGDITQTDVKSPNKDHLQGGGVNQKTGGGR